MKDDKEATHSQEPQEGITPSATDAVSQPESSNRRQLIERYGKYAIVAAPLLMFVSKAHAIHSRP
jgi:hypothetical protein